jgi:hypothetical protein
MWPQGRFFRSIFLGKLFNFIPVSWYRPPGHLVTDLACVDTDGSGGFRYVARDARLAYRNNREGLQLITRSPHPDQAVCGTYVFVRLDDRIGLLPAKCRSALTSNGRNSSGSVNTRLCCR